MADSIIDGTGSGFQAKVTSYNAIVVTDLVSNSFTPSYYDYISLGSYSGDNPGTIVFKSGGSTGAQISLLNLAYNASGNLTSVTKI
jgi:hypothetical protein